MLDSEIVQHLVGVLESGEVDDVVGDAMTTFEMSRSVAQRRVVAAQVAAKHPRVIAMIRDRTITFASLEVIKLMLGDTDLVEYALGKSAQDIRLLISERFESAKEQSAAQTNRRTRQDNKAAGKKGAQSATHAQARRGLGHPLEPESIWTLIDWLIEFWRSESHQF